MSRVLLWDIVVVAPGKAGRGEGSFVGAWSTQVETVGTGVS